MNPTITVTRLPMRATTLFPWRAHCVTCCQRVREVCEELDVPGAALPVPATSWFRATWEQAQAIALGHWASHEEVPS